jgi:hypothetical protein
VVCVGDYLVRVGCGVYITQVRQVEVLGSYPAVFGRHRCEAGVIPPQPVATSVFLKAGMTYLPNSSMDFITFS